MSISAVSSGAPNDISNAVAEILAAVDADVAARRPVCRASGLCCKFEQYGHRMYVTAIETIHFANVHGGGTKNPKSDMSHSSTVSLPQFFASESPQGCPYQVAGLCTAREARPLGCRIYFCDENAQSWQNELYEKYHAQLTALHARFGIPYRYIEWRAALKEMIA